MNYFLYKLKFTTAVHFGSSDSALGIQSSEDHFRADTLFSALCQTALKSGDSLEKLFDMAKNHELLLTDSMPYADEVCYLPKPIRRFESGEETPAEKRKKLKSIQWVPVTADPAGYNKEVSLGSFFSREQAAITGLDNASPYEVGQFAFAPGCGLYFICALKDAEKESWLTSLLTLLGLSGIGGRASSGLGKFEADDVIYLNEPFDGQTESLFNGLENTDSNHQMLLTTALPAEDELQAVLEQATFQVVRRGGFVQSDCFSRTPLKKRTQYFLTAGTIVQKRFKGDLYQVGEYGTHPVYRYSIPLFMGVKI